MRGRAGLRGDARRWGTAEYRRPIGTPLNLSAVPNYLDHTGVDVHPGFIRVLIRADCDICSNIIPSF